MTFFLFQGTTGEPKGALLSHHNVVNNAYCFGGRFDYESQVMLMADPELDALSL